MVKLVMRMETGEERLVKTFNTYEEADTHRDEILDDYPESSFFIEQNLNRRKK